MVMIGIPGGGFALAIKLNSINNKLVASIETIMTAAKAFMFQVLMYVLLESFSQTFLTKLKKQSVKVS